VIGNQGAGEDCVAQKGVRTQAWKASQLTWLGRKRLVGREPAGNHTARAGAEEGSGAGDWGEKPGGADRWCSSGLRVAGNG
jgi:hypothetical protein